MHIEELRTLLKARPFQPFTVCTTDGAALPVWQPDFALLSPNGRTLWLYQRDYSCDMLDVLLIPRFSLTADPNAGAAPEEAPQPEAV